jgi:arabinosyltransferase
VILGSWLLPALSIPTYFEILIKRPLFLADRYGVLPYVVHATFQRFAPGVYQSSAKRGRFRELGMWLLPNATYYDPDAKYLAYTLDVVGAVLAAERSFPGGRIPPLYKHWLAISYQYAAFRDALAIARALGRALILPPAICWCDIDSTPHVLERCAVRGSEMLLSPMETRRAGGGAFHCPADYLYQVPFLEIAGFDFRLPGFLDDPQVPPRLLDLHPVARFLAGKPSAEMVGVGKGIGEVLFWPGITGPDVVKAAVAVQNTPLLHIV